MRTPGLVVLLLTTTAHAGEPVEPDDLPAPQPEIARDEPKVVLPAVPAFELPVIEPGVHRPRELRLRGAGVLGTEIAVKGYVTSVYDCAAELALRNPELSRAVLLDAVDRDPRQCDRPKFYLGETGGAPIEASISVVDVPRRPAKPERDALSRAELASWPAVPNIAVGNHVVVTGTWATRSPHGEYNSEGLLVYKAVARAADTATTARPPAAAASAPVEVAIVPRPPLRPLVANPVFNASVDHLNACNKRIVAGRYDDGIAECEAAARAWPGNHLAWYEAAGAYIAERAWREARDAAARAVAMRPDRAMYQLYYGLALYEAEQQRVREAQAQREHRRPDEVAIDPSALDLDAARDALVRATRIGPELWRAHYYLGRVYRDRDDARHAAEQFTQAIAAHPSYRAAYIALIELYRRWDYVDQALAVAMVGVAHVSPADARQLWYEAGMALHAKRIDDQALAAFDKALAGDPGDVLSRFVRGQLYLRKGRLADARRELEQVVRSSDPQVADAKPIAVQLLQQIARKQLRSAPRTADCNRYETCTRDTEGVIDDGR
jgi:tetratricopeptide (TPR) repeat protein